MTTDLFVPTAFHNDGAAVTVFGSDSGTFYLVVRRGGCERVRPISHHDAYQYRDSKSADVELEITQMKAELVHAIRQGEGNHGRG